MDNKYFDKFQENENIQGIVGHSKNQDEISYEEISIKSEYKNITIGRIPIKFHETIIIPKKKINI